MKITITPEDIERKKMSFSDSNQVIDELAYCASQLTGEDLRENNMEFESCEPYQFDFESDLLANTKTQEQLNDIVAKLNSHLPGKFTKDDGLQAGASLALNYPAMFEELLSNYTEAVQEQDDEDSQMIISEAYKEAYKKELNEAKDYWWKNLEKEWLYGDRDYRGVIYEIGNYFTESPREAEYNQKADIFTFELSDYDLEQLLDDEDEEVKDMAIVKDLLLDSIISSGNNRHNADMATREKRKAEAKRQAEYQAERKAQAEEKRIAKLKSMTI